MPVASGCMLRQFKNSVDNIKDQIVNSVSFPTPSTNTHSMELSEDCRTSMNRNCTLMSASTDLPNTRENSVYLNTSAEDFRDPASANTSWHGRDVTDGAVTTQLEDLVIVILSFLSSALAFIFPIVLP